MRFLDRVTFDGYTISRAEYLFLAAFARANQIRTVLEYGPGASTWAFLEAGCRVTSLEYLPEWREKFAVSLAECPEARQWVTLLPFDADRQSIDGREAGAIRGLFDLGFVDSPRGDRCQKFSRLRSCLSAAARCRRFILHDADRPKERNTLDVMRELGWQVLFLQGGKLALLDRV